MRKAVVMARRNMLPVKLVMRFVHFTNKFSFNKLYNCTLDRLIYSALSMAIAKHSLHVDGLKQWLKEDLLNSSIPWLGLEPGTSVSPF